MARRRLDVEMVRRGLTGSRRAAQEAIQRKTVTVGGAIAEKASRMVAPGEPIEMLGPPPRYVSRGGKKLEHGLAAFGIDPAGLRCLDVGASTGGFTDCLLQAGAARVYAVDVGKGQLAQRLRDDPRVVLHERTNARQMSLDTVEGEVVDLAVVDVSFISLRLVIPPTCELVRFGAPVVALVKPQFEAAQEKVGKGGIVRDPEVWRAVLLGLVDFLAGRGVVAEAVVPSPITGADGNVEFLALLHEVADAWSPGRSMVEDAVAKAADPR